MWGYIDDLYLSLLAYNRPAKNLPGFVGQTSVLTDPQTALCQLLEVLKTALLPRRTLVSGTSCRGTCRPQYCSTEQETGYTSEDTTSHKPTKSKYIESKDYFKKKDRQNILKHAINLIFHKVLVEPSSERFPADDSGGGNKLSLWFFPTQTVLWFYDEK